MGDMADEEVSNMFTFDCDMCGRLAAYCECEEADFKKPKRRKTVKRLNAKETKTLVSPPADDSKEALAVKAAEAAEALAFIEAMEIRDSAGMASANEILAGVKAEWKMLEEKKKKATDHLRLALDEIRSWFRPAQDFFARAEEVIKRKVLEARRREKEAEDAALRVVAEAARAGRQEEAKEAIAALAAVEISRPLGLAIVERWAFEIVDASALPRDYLIPDMARIGKSVRDGHGQTIIPGVRQFRDDYVRKG